MTLFINEVPTSKQAIFTLYTLDLLLYFTMCVKCTLPSLLTNNTKSGHQLIESAGPSCAVPEANHVEQLVDLRLVVLHLVVHQHQLARVRAVDLQHAEPGLRVVRPDQVESLQ